MICPECNGTGWIKEISDNLFRPYDDAPCYMCKGEGSISDTEILETFEDIFGDSYYDGRL